ncbi:chromosome segregation protein SMC [Pokkaliibacter plantistimulans]|uniref:Chromosome segregation protein SMC n=1 Tax=Pokkaliibacter plantistimulans TaxID=1635171 RepID=A0ABX5LZL4_9GAMM|nr:AAA family ATPase [Pokkaliibacter plantistimulans]PXF32127.1 chromosome segregation protein SMC [Pokkaliibacter plantistimulans]
MIKTIQIDGFKSIATQSVELGSVNCFIGANGVGKSNILEAIGVLGAAANGKVDDESLLRRGVRPGMPRLYKTSFDGHRTPPAIGLGASSDGAEYRVSLLNPLEAPEPAWTYKTERLSEGDRTLISGGVRNRGHLSATAGLAALKMADIPPDNVSAQLMLRLQNYAIYSPNTPALRAMAVDPQSRNPVGLSGGRLAEAFAELRKAVLEHDESLLDDVLELIDWVADVDTTTSAGQILSPSVAHSKYLMKFTDRFMGRSRNELTAYDASEGALYILFCAVLCLSPVAPKTFAIDNLDQALNPRLLTRLTSRLKSWLAHADNQRQMLFTVHNPAVLDGLDLDDDEVRLFVVERNNHGHTCVRRIELNDDLRARNATYPLSRLWLMGSLGAVPNV